MLQRQKTKKGIGKNTSKELRAVRPLYDKKKKKKKKQRGEKRTI